MPDAFGLVAIVTKMALYLGVLTSAGTVMATLLFGLVRTRGMTDPEILGLLWNTPVGTALLLRLVGLRLRTY